jgi:hypothetical protein
MTDSGKAAGKPAKPVTQSKRAHWLAIVGLLLIALSGPLAKAGLFSPMLGMLGYTIASLLLFIALIIAALALFGNRNSNVLQNSWTTWLVVALGVGITGLNVATINSSRGSPAIHDITTDVNNPPEFVDIVALREADDAANPSEYLDNGSAELQLAALPEIRTIVLQESYDEVFADALDATEDMGWQIVTANLAEGRIEAVATTGYVGFKDDVVIRIRKDGNAVAVDIRSKSRMGKGDMGANAKRIVAWTDELID